MCYPATGEVHRTATLLTNRFFSAFPHYGYWLPIDWPSIIEEAQLHYRMRCPAYDGSKQYVFLTNDDFPYTPTQCWAILKGIVRMQHCECFTDDFKTQLDSCPFFYICSRNAKRPGMPMREPDRKTSCAACESDKPGDPEGKAVQLKKPGKLYNCERCLAIKYCSRECQRQYWKQHETSRECIEMQAVRCRGIWKLLCSADGRWGFFILANIVEYSGLDIHAMQETQVLGLQGRSRFDAAFSNVHHDRVKSKNVAVNVRP